MLLFYCDTIAYHVELNANSGGRRHSANIQEKWTHNTGEMPWNRGDPSRDVAIHFFRVGREYRICTFYYKERDLKFIWIYLSLDTETTSGADFTKGLKLSPFIG